MIRKRGLYWTYRVPQMLNKGPNLIRLHMSHLIGANIAAWYDFCSIKNLNFTPPPGGSCINRMRENQCAMVVFIQRQRK